MQSTEAMTTHSSELSEVPQSDSAASALLLPGLTRQYLVHHRICPKAGTDRRGAIVLACAPNALLDSCLTELVDAYNSPIEIEVHPWTDVEAMIERLHGDQLRRQPASLGEGPESIISGFSADSVSSDTDIADVREIASQPPVVRFVNLLIRDALSVRASDIHLEAGVDGLATRIRVDGVLVSTVEPPAELASAVISRVKLLAELDIAERRKPQDGRIRVRLSDRELDIRVSTVPTMHGESVVLRLLDGRGRPIGLGELGMPSQILNTIAEIARRPHGMMLVTGPTGSGKTTTLYACLQQRNLAVEKVITVEDPIEYRLDAVTQVPVHNQAGVTFGSALRSILRQDPDVVMLGEMRDAETAQVAVQAAMTGHLVLSTLHTNDALGAIPRLLDLDVPAYLVAATLEAVVAQRLVRRICAGCRIPVSPPAAFEPGIARSKNPLELVSQSTPHGFARGAGCKACRGTGYHGRVGLYELLVMTEELREGISHGATRVELRGMIEKTSFRPLRLDGYEKARAGITTLEEVERVSQA